LVSLAVVAVGAAVEDLVGAVVVVAVVVAATNPVALTSPP